jgi:hypothetical protein
MPDKPSYEDHENQPLHRPGMATVVNRGADTRDANGNRTTDDRPQVGPGHADPFGAASASDPALPPAAKPAPAAPAGDGSGTGGRTREAVIQQNVEKAVTGTP